MISENKRLRVALVGCGTVSSNHLASIAASECADVVALCDIKPERAKARAEEYKISPKIFTDLEEMLDEVKPDVLHISTPHYLHAPMAIAALDRGINVFLEKPIGISEEDIKALLEAEKRSSAKICVCFQNRFNSTTVIAKKIADEDGGVIEGYGALFWQRNEKYYTESGWRGAYATEGGGVMINQAIHTIDLLCFFLGIPEKVSATIANHHLKGIIEVEDSCGGRVLFENGKLANFYATNACVSFDTNTIFLKTKNHKIEIISPARLYVDGEEIELEKHQNYVGKECYGVGHFTVIKKFYTSIFENSEVPVTLKSAQYALKLLLAAYRSGGEEVTIEY